MAPIEVFFGAIIFVFALIGLARGFLKELGVTTIVMFLLFFLSLFEPFLDTGLTRAMSFGGRAMVQQNKDLFKCWFFVLILIGTTFISYQGETLAFGGQAPRGAQGIALGVLTGVLNGYLIAGSIWFYLDKFRYPITFMGFAPDGLSTFAINMIDFLPIRFLGQPVILGQSLLLYLSGLLLIARVIR